MNENVLVPTLISHKAWCDKDESCLPACSGAVSSSHEIPTGSQLVRLVATGETHSVYLATRAARAGTAHSMASGAMSSWGSQSV